MTEPLMMPLLVTLQHAREGTRTGQGRPGISVDPSRVLAVVERWYQSAEVWETKVWIRGVDQPFTVVERRAADVLVDLAGRLDLGSTA